MSHIEEHWVLEMPVAIQLSVTNMSRLAREGFVWDACYRTHNSRVRSTNRGENPESVDRVDPLVAVVPDDGTTWNESPKPVAS